jgi:hypothetical protein
MDRACKAQLRTSKTNSGFLRFGYATIKLKMWTAVVTGSNRGLGLAFVKALVKRGFVVYATCRDCTDAQELKDFSTQHPGQVCQHSRQPLELI